MIEFKKGNLFGTDAEVIVNATNCIGVMGGGIAKQFSTNWPTYYQNYLERCNKGLEKVGQVYMFDELKIVSFPTKGNLGNTRFEYLEDGLNDLREMIRHCNVNSIAMPALGCGLGGMEWAPVKKLIEELLGEVNCRIEVYEPL